MNAMTRSRRGSAAFAAPPPAGAVDNPQTPAEICAAIQKAFHDFKAKNDERLAQIEKGRDDAVTAAEVEKINARIGELSTHLDDTMRSLGRLTAGGAGSPDVAGERAHAARFFATARRQRARADDPNLDLAAYRAYRDAFAELVRRECNPDGLADQYRAALSIGSDRDGGYLVPDEMSTEMERRIHETSPMRGIARVMTIGGPAWEAPFKSSKGVSGGWVGEKQARTATGTGTLGMQRIETHDQYAYPEATQAMLDDAAINVEDFLIEDTEEEMSRTENLAFVSGTGVLQPRGFLDYGAASVTTADASRAWGVLQYVASGAAGAFAKQATPNQAADDAGPFIDTIAALNPAYRQGAVWTMNRSTEAAVRKLVDGDGRYIVGFGDIRDAALGFNLFGFPIVNLEDMPNIAADSFSIGFGNFRRGYFIVDRMGFRVLRDPYTNKPYVGFYITKRTGGDVRNFDAIKLIKFAAA